MSTTTARCKSCLLWDWEITVHKVYGSPAFKDLCLFEENNHKVCTPEAEGCPDFAPRDEQK